MKQMKKVLIMLMAIAMLSVTGCSDQKDKEDTSSKSDVSDSADEDEDNKDDEEDEEDEDSEKEEDSKKDKDSKKDEEDSKKEEEDSKKDEEDSKQEETDSETAAETEEESAEDSAAQPSGDAADLSGFWKYEDEYEVGYLQFTEDQMIVYFDMSGDMHFEDGEFWINGVEEEEGVAEIVEEVDGSELTIIAKNYATDEEVVFLVLEAAEGQDAEDFTGRYLLIDSEDASIASYIGESDTYFYLKDDLMLIGMAAECELIDDQTLTMSFDGETEEMTYELDGDTLLLTDSFGDTIEVIRED